MPTWDYDLLHERDQVTAYADLADLTDALDNAHSTLTRVEGETDPRQYMYLKLQFMLPIKLLGEVTCTSFEEHLHFPITGVLRHDSSKNYFYWRIAKVDTESLKKGKHQKKTTRSAGTALFDDPPVRMQGTYK